MAASLLASPARRRLLLAAVPIIAGAIAGVAGHRAYQRHERQLALERLIEEACDECARRHQAQLLLRDLLQRQRAETPAAAAPATGEAE